MKNDVNFKRLDEFARKDKRVLALIVFGSYARKEKYRDIDICIVLDKKFHGKYLNVIKTFVREFSDSFDFSIFHKLPLYIRKQVLKEGKILFCANMDELYDVATDFIKEYRDFEPKYRAYLEMLTE